MNVANGLAQILHIEGVEVLVGYPNTPIIEAAAQADIRTVIVRQERTGLHMADAISRLTSGQQTGVFCMQQGPGAENSFGGIAQAFGDSAPIVVLPTGYPRRLSGIHPNFNATWNVKHITKSAEQLLVADVLPEAMRRAFTQVRNGRPGPVLVEFPRDIYQDELSRTLAYRSAPRVRFAPDPRDVSDVARVLTQARRPVIYAGQGVHMARAWPQLRQLAELLEAPVTTSLQGKSAFPEDHPLSLGSGGHAISAQLHHFLNSADVIFGIGCSFTATNYGITIPSGKIIVHATLDALDVNKSVEADHILLGDAALTLDALLAEVKERLKTAPHAADGSVREEIASRKSQWLEQWQSRLSSDATPLSPYRVIRDLMRSVDRSNVIITHDAGSPRDQLSPFWESTAPLSYLGWGKTTQLGTGLGLAMGAKLAQPEKLCINVWGDAAIGFTGMDFETAVREQLPILSVLLNNSSMAIELHSMQTATRKYRSTDISGNYAELARALGGYGERIADPHEIVPAIRRGIAETRAGRPALLEFITQQETALSTFPAPTSG
jgi:acetolactate synthase-1/2/3 large subunit